MAQVVRSVSLLWTAVLRCTLLHVICYERACGLLRPKTIYSLLPEILADIVILPTMLACVQHLCPFVCGPIVTLPQTARCSRTRLPSRRRVAQMVLGPWSDPGSLAVLMGGRAWHAGFRLQHAGTRNTRSIVVAMSRLASKVGTGFVAPRGVLADPISCRCTCTRTCRCSWPGLATPGGLNATALVTGLLVIFVGRRNTCAASAGRQRIMDSSAGAVRATRASHRLIRTPTHCLLSKVRTMVRPAGTRESMATGGTVGQVAQ